jgi:tRNA pseudouridine38-40 synthase
VARSRTYRYRLWVAPARPVFERGQVWPLRGKLDDALLAEAARSLVGEHDFSALTPSAHLYHSCVRAVSAAAWHRAPGGQEWLFEITAGSFLHNMVRVAVGSMVDVAQGRMTLQSFAEGLAGGERRSMGQTAPPCGLALVAVAY